MEFHSTVGTILLRTAFGGLLHLYRQTTVLALKVLPTIMFHVLIAKVAEVLNMYRCFTVLHKTHLHIQVVNLFGKPNKASTAQLCKHKALPLDRGVDVCHLHDFLIGTVDPVIVLGGCGVPVLGNTQQRERQPPKLFSFKRLNLSQFVLGDVNPVQPNQWKLGDILCQLVQNIRPLDKRDGWVTLQESSNRRISFLLYWFA